MNRLREIRKKKNISIKEITELLNITDRTYYAIERGESELSESMIIKLSKNYNLSADYILNLSDFNRINTEEEKERLKMIESLEKVIN